LNELHERWLHPPELVQCAPEAVPDYPDRVVLTDAAAEAALKERTLAKLYNVLSAWLDRAKTLDEAVAEAYGWGWRLACQQADEEEILTRLFRLNQERAAAQRSTDTPRLGADLRET
jgi:hypothetical protein